jgi:hypothetical protein
MSGECCFAGIPQRKLGVVDEVVALGLCTGPTPKINRKDFGLTWNAALRTGGLLVDVVVQIMLGPAVH